MATVYLVCVASQHIVVVLAFIGHSSTGAGLRRGVSSADPNGSEVTLGDEDSNGRFERVQLDLTGIRKVFREFGEKLRVRVPRPQEPTLVYLSGSVYPVVRYCRRWRWWTILSAWWRLVLWWRVFGGIGWTILSALIR